MAYCDYGAFVYCNGERRTDKEDASLFIPYNDWVEGEQVDALPEAAMILDALEDGEPLPDEMRVWSRSTHGVMGDNRIRVACYKYGMPYIYEWEEGAKGPQEIVVISGNNDDEDCFSYKPLDFEYKGYRFHFESGKHEDSERVSPYLAEMTEPNGTTWRCTYDYGFGAGFPEDELDETGYYISYKTHDSEEL